MSAISTSQFPAACTVCQGAITDNRPKKASGEYNAKYPDWKCQNESCMTNGYRTGGYVKTDPAQSTEAAQVRQARPLATWESYDLLYARCQHLALKRYSTKWAEANPSAYVAVVHTFWIQANRDGLKAIASAVQAPPPEPEYPPLPEESDDQLPF